MTMQSRISRAQHDEPRLGRGLPVQEPHKRHATLQRLVPHDGGLEVQRRLIFACAEILETASVLDVDLPGILAPCPTALRVRTGGETPAIGVAPQRGDRVQSEADDFSTLLLLRRGAIHAML